MRDKRGWIAAAAPCISACNAVIVHDVQAYEETGITLQNNVGAGEQPAMLMTRRYMSSSVKSPVQCPRGDWHTPLLCKCQRLTQQQM